MKKLTLLVAAVIAIVPGCFPQVAAQVAEVSELAGGADHSKLFQSLANDAVLAPGALLAVLFQVVQGQSFLEGSLLFSRKDSDLPALTVLPDSVAGDVVHVCEGTSDLVLFCINQGSDQGSHRVATDVVAAGHLGCALLAGYVVDSVFVSDHFDYLSQGLLVLLDFESISLYKFYFTQFEAIFQDGSFVPERHRLGFKGICVLIVDMLFKFLNGRLQR